MPWIIKQTVDLNQIDRRGVCNRLIQPLAYPGDRNAHVWEVTVERDGQPVALGGLTPVATFVRVNGTKVKQNGSVSGNVASVILPPASYALPGLVQAVMRITGEDETTPVAALAYFVSEDIDSDPIDPGEIMPSVDDYIGCYYLSKTVVDELADVRMGLSGTLYGTAGDAVRAELAAVRDALEAAKLDAPDIDGAAGQVLTHTGTGVEWRNPAAPTDAQTAAALAAWLETHPITVPDLGWVTPEMFGAAGDGATDDSAAIQAAVDSGKNVRFISAYRAKNVAISRDIILEGVGGATIKPLAFSTTSNQFLNVFTTSGADVIIRNINFVGLGAAVTATTATQSLIRAEGGNIRLYGCSFSGFYTVNLPAPALVDRFANILFAVGCTDAVEIVGCTFTDLGGEEIVYVVPGAATPLVRRCCFAHNIIRNVSGYSFNLFADHLRISDNYVSGFYGPTNLLAVTVFNCWALSAVCEGNTVINSDARDVFDFAEPYAPASGYCGTMLRGYTVRILDNYADLSGGVFAVCVGERVTLENNRVRGGALYQGYCTNGPVGNNPAAMQPTSILDADQVRIVGNIFVYRASAKAETLTIRAAIEPYNAGYLASAVYEGRKQLRRCEIRDNELRFPEDGPGIPAIQLDTMIEHCWITGNVVRNPGIVGGLRSADMRLMVKVIAAWAGGTMRRLTVAGNTVHSDDTDSILETVAVICTNSSATSQYGFDLANEVAVVDLDAENNQYDREHNAATIYGTIPPRVTRMTKFDLTPAVSASLISGRGVYYRETNTVRLYLRINNETELNGTLFTVPEGYRPGATRSGLYGALSVTGTGGLLACSMVVGTDGSVSVHAGETVHVAKLTGCIEYTL